jgi:hypothetical protein
VTLRRGVVAAVVALELLGVSAAAPPAGAALRIPRVTIVAREYSLSLPSTVRAGLVRFELVNRGTEEHQAQILMLHPGITVQQLIGDGMAHGDQGVLGDGDAFGGPNIVAPGRLAAVIDRLAPGRYVVVCFVHAPDGVSHYNKGMVAPFTVTRGRGTIIGRSPAPAQTVTQRDFSFDVPGGTLPRRGLIAVQNAGTQTHELSIEKLAPGKTLDDAKKAFARSTPPPGPPVSTPAGGLLGIAPGETGWVDVRLSPGSYVLTCFFQDATKNGLPHFVEGMIEQVTVR